MIYPQDSCYFCGGKLKKITDHERYKKDLFCSNKSCSNKYQYGVVTSDCNMIEFSIGEYKFEYYFKAENDSIDPSDLASTQGMRVLRYANRQLLEVVIDIREDRHYYATLDNYLEIVEKCRKLSLFK